MADRSAEPEVGWRSGPGQRNSFHSERTTQDRSRSRPRRCFTFGGISTARAGCSGGEQVTGHTRTRVSPGSAFQIAAMIARGNDFSACHASGPLERPVDHNSGMIRFMNPSNNGTVKAVSPWAGL